MTNNLRNAAIYYFFSAFIVVILALIGYFLMHRTVTILKFNLIYNLSKNLEILQILYQIG